MIRKSILEMTSRLVDVLAEGRCSYPLGGTVTDSGARLRRVVFRMNTDADPWSYGYQSENTCWVTRRKYADAHMIRVDIAADGAYRLNKANYTIQENVVACNDNQLRDALLKFVD